MVPPVSMANGELTVLIPVAWNDHGAKPVGWRRDRVDGMTASIRRRRCRGQQLAGHHQVEIYGRAGEHLADLARDVSPAPSQRGPRG